MKIALEVCLRSKSPTSPSLATSFQVSYMKQLLPPSALAPRLTFVHSFSCPVVGVSVCDSMSFLQTLIDMVDELVEEGGNSSNTTFSALETKLESLLDDAIPGGSSSVDVVTTSDDDRSVLTIEIVQTYEFSRTLEVAMDIVALLEGTTLDDTFDPNFFDTFIPSSGAAELGFSAVLDITFGLGLEYVSATDEILPFVMGSTGISATLQANGDLEFEVRRRSSTLPTCVSCTLVCCESVVAQTTLNPFLCLGIYWSLEGGDSRQCGAWYGC